MRVQSLATCLNVKGLKRKLCSVGNRDVSPRLLLDPVVCPLSQEHSAIYLATPVFSPATFFKKKLYIPHCTSLL